MGEVCCKRTCHCVSAEVTWPCFSHSQEIKAWVYFVCHMTKVLSTQDARREAKQTRTRKKQQQKMLSSFQFLTIGWNTVWGYWSSTTLTFILWRMTLHATSNVGVKMGPGSFFFLRGIARCVGCCFQCGWARRFAQWHFGVEVGGGSGAVQARWWQQQWLSSLAGNRKPGFRFLE